MPRAGIVAVFILIAVAGATAAVAQPPDAIRFSLGSAEVELGGQVRLRFENEEAFDVRGYRPSTDDRFLLSRVMLDASVRLSPRHRVFIELRDARGAGSQLTEHDFPRSNPFVDPLDIRQLYYEGSGLVGSWLSVRLGRQQISYGDQRVFGAGQWGNTGRWTWDAALLNLKGTRLDADVWIGRPVRNRPDRWPNASVPEPVAGVAYVRARGLPLRFDMFYVHKEDRSGKTAGEHGAGNLRSESMGFQAEGTRGRLDYGLTGVVQRGWWGQDRIRAAGASGILGARLLLPWQPRLRAVLTWGSGDRDPHDGVHATFDGVLGGADITFYGYCSLFFWANIWDREVQLLLHPSERLDLHIRAHAFALASGRDAWYSTSLSTVRRDPTGSSGTDMGREIDARAVYRARPWLELMAGIGYYLPGSFVRQTGPAPRGLWHMLQATWAW